MYYLSMVIFLCGPVPGNPRQGVRVFIGSKNWYPDPDPAIPGAKTQSGFHTRVIH